VTPTRAAATLALVGALAACGGAGGSSPPPQAQPTPSPAPTLAPVDAPGPPYDRGPAPSVTALEADLGPFAVGTLAVAPEEAIGYRQGTISYPTETDEGPFGAIAVSPGYTGVQRSMAWLGPRLASNGFVVIVIDTEDLRDNAESRAAQLVFALEQVVAFSATPGHPLFGLVDGNRLGVIGHSYGGGGALLAGTEHPSLRAVIPLAPFYESTSFAGLTVPTLIMGCQYDTVAPVAARAIPIYESIPASVSKAYLELARGDHLCVETGNGNKAIQGKYAVAWAKLFLDDDGRYWPFLCGAPHAEDLRGDAVSAYRDNCPY